MYSSKVDFVAFDDVTLTRSKEVSNFVGDHFHAEKRQCELDSKNDVFERVLSYFAYFRARAELYFKVLLRKAMAEQPS